ncbi:ParB N-terminal domain-containing protein [Eubacteriales bacterium OttesenSCG-928-K08]|nr:ParB N-terminal domain-containing protein [Eubacteriales bacterium OttesenSCG-928-K08]
MANRINKVVMLKTSDIVPYENNPRINDESVKYVANSIKEFGFRQPIVIDKDNVIIAGHTRLKAAILIGLQEVPCIVADDLTKNQAAAYRLADNKVGEASSWDYVALEIELSALCDYSMPDYGFLDMSELLETDLTGDKAGASPWERMSGASADGVIFTFGEISARQPQEIYEKFLFDVGEENINEWLLKKLQ